MGERIGYIRVSDKSQNTSRQEMLLEEQNCKRIYIDKASGKNTDREQLKAMMDFIREEDTVIVPSIDRLARSARDFLNIQHDLDSKGIKLISLKENLDSDTPMGKAMISIAAVFGELERSLIKSRQEEGIKAAKQNGVTFGRPKIELTKEIIEVINKWRNGNIKGVEAIKLSGLSKASFYRKVKELEGDECE